MSKDPLASYAKKIKRPLSDAERQAIGAAPSSPSGDPRKLKRQVRSAATKARRKELGLKAKAR
jgi:hypothetical protein